MMRVIELGDLVYAYRDAALSGKESDGTWEALEAERGKGWVDEMFDSWVRDGKIIKHPPLGANQDDE